MVLKYITYNNIYSDETFAADKWPNTQQPNSDLSIKPKKSAKTEEFVRLEQLISKEVPKKM